VINQILFIMKHLLAFSTVMICSVIVFCLSGCDKQDNNPIEISTTAPGDIGSNSAKSGGSITSDGGSTISSRGICWAKTPAPTTKDSKKEEGSGAGAFTAVLSGLTPKTTYFVRAFATNSVGTVYGNEHSFKTLDAGSSVTDIEGNSYPIVKIGTQTWMASNLKTTKLNDGTAIALKETVNDWINSGTQGTYCWYDNNQTSHASAYGALYNWYNVNTGKLCPVGWKVPTDQDWTTLTTYLGGDAAAGPKLKESGTSHWITTSAAITNESGFTARPGGFRHIYADFTGINNYAGWWTNTEMGTGHVWIRYIVSNPHTLQKTNVLKTEGHSVRCIKE